ncbi:MAG: RES family NAD+ phosphorylase [Dehalococcoidia bacterium]
MGSLQGSAWRGHNRRYDATDHGGSLNTTGRYHRGPDQYPAGPVWPALYLSLAPHTAVLEIDRQFSSTTWENRRNYRFTELAVTLSAILDCRDVGTLGLTLDHLCDDYDWSIPQALAAAARDIHAEGILVPSATRWGDNLIVFPDLRRPSSSFEIVRFHEPQLYRRSHQR